MQVNTTIEEFVIALETNHGVPQGKENYATGGYLDDSPPDTVCAVGNVALDYLKRSGVERTANNVRRWANTIHEAFNTAILHKLNHSTDYSLIPAEFRIHNINDRTDKDFDEIAQSLRETLQNHGISLDTPIHFSI